jgi:RNA polymerase sigma-70 factor (ECF subfamily)
MTPPSLSIPNSEVRTRLAEILPDLRARAMRLARDPAVADDILQDAVERALRFEHQYEADTNLRAWMSRILLSVFISRCRRSRRERRATEMLAADPCAWTLPDPAPCMRALSPCALRALEAIPEAFRRTIELVDIAELPYRDAADTLGVPLGTVMSRLFRGRKLLAQALA